MLQKKTEPSLHATEHSYRCKVESHSLPLMFLSFGFCVYRPFVLHQAGAFSFSIKEEENQSYLPKKQTQKEKD